MNCLLRLLRFWMRKVIQVCILSVGFHKYCHPPPPELVTVNFCSYCQNPTSTQIRMDDSKTPELVTVTVRKRAKTIKTLKIYAQLFRLRHSSCITPPVASSQGPKAAKAAFAFSGLP
jgi:hypothetical protein